MQINSAYIDASSISMVIAAVAGVAVTLGAIAAVYFRRAKNVLMEMLEIKGGTRLVERQELKANFDRSFKGYANEKYEKLFLKVEDKVDTSIDPFDE